MPICRYIRFGYTRVGLGQADIVKCRGQDGCMWEERDKLLKILSGSLISSDTKSCNQLQKHGQNTIYHS